MQLEWVAIEDVENTEDLLSENSEMMICYGRKH